MTLREVTRTVISLVEKGAAHVLMPISARKQLNDLPDDVLTKVALFYYSDPRDALIKGLAFDLIFGWRQAACTYAKARRRRVDSKWQVFLCRESV